MNRTERISVNFWVLPCWFCWSTAWAASPVRWTASPGGRPTTANSWRMSATSRVAAGPVDPGGTSKVTRAWRARPSTEVPWSLTLATRGMPATASSTRPTAETSTADSRPEVVAATSMASDVVVERNGAASRAASWLGMVVGMNCELLFFSTLEIPGRKRVRATVATTQATTTIQR